MLNIGREEEEEEITSRRRAHAFGLSPTCKSSCMWVSPVGHVYSLLRALCKFIKGKESVVFSYD